jgi:CheY-like chemotaxis protein
MRKKILLVDDSQQMSGFMCPLLRDEGHEVVTAEDGLSALTLLTSFTPDIIFFDLVMPRIGGDTLCRIVRTMKHLQDCFLVLVTAAAVRPDFDLAETGADACIAKGLMNSSAENILDVINNAESHKDDGKPKGTDPAGTRARGMAHDLNNILGIILGYTEMTKLDLRKQNPAYENLEKVHSACLRAKDLVKKFLSFNRQSGFEPSPVDAFGERHYDGNRQY